MKKRQLSQKKLAAATVEKSQAKISSFFTKLPKPDTSNNKTVSDVSCPAENPVDRKRKERLNTSQEHVNVKRQCTSDHMLKDPCVFTTENIKIFEDSVLLKDENDVHDSCKENKVKHEQTDALLEKVTKREINAVSPVKTEYDVTRLQNSDSAEDVNISEVVQSNSHVLKESQDMNIVAPKSSPAKEIIDQNRVKLLDVKKVQAFGDFFEDKDEFNDFFDEEWHAQIDLTTLQRCKIIDVKHESQVTILRVQHAESESVDTVACSEFWKDVRVKTDDIVMIQAKKKSQWWIIDNNDGLLITQPDMLIAGTTITSGLFCNRRAVLSEKFRRLESLPSQNGDCTMMTVGSLVHQWLQKALWENVHALYDVNKLLKDMLRSKDTIEYLYASEMTLEDCRRHMMEYAPRIFEFIQHYIKGNKQGRINSLKDNFQGSICNIQDIEENIYVPKLGIKGRIDVTAEVKIHSRRKVMPLEVKTGRASYSPEHRGQVILYLMMMDFMSEEIDTGLLLYLKGNQMQEIEYSHHEKRDLILLRNTLAHYFARKPDNLQDTSSDLKAMELPEPISHHSACLNCPYQTVCCAYLARDPNVNLKPSHPLTPLMKKLLDSIESSHLDYIMKWIALLRLEEREESKNDVSSTIWTMSPEKREARGTCICNLKVLGKVVEQDNKYQHTFARVNITGEAIENGTIPNAIKENDYVIISTDTRFNIVAGNIMHVSHDTVTVLLDKDITRQYIHAHSIFHIDKHPFFRVNLFTCSYANVAGLLNNDKISVKLRHIVIDRRPATFVEKLPRSVVSTSAKILNDLNEDQQRAVLKAVAADDYVLIKGMPGTGKTQTLVALIELLQELGLSVLVTAHTNSAVDNVLLKLLERDIDFLRLGFTRKIHPLLTCKSEEYAIASCDSPESLETLYNSKRIVGMTCFGAYNALLRRRSFDVCLVDESTQIMQPTVLRPLYSADKFVLVGDPDQLPPIVRNRTAVRLGADESLFVRLDTDNNTVKLSKQYRMNGRIMKLANDLTYRGNLVAGSRQVENAILTGKNMERILSCETWIRNALSRNLDDSVVILDTGRTYNLEPRHENGKSDQLAYANVWEAGVVSRLVQVLMEAGVHARNIGVIAPYNAHINLLKTIIDKEVEVNTVDQYQGRDKDVILYSCAKSMEHDTKKEFEILDDQRRLTVAITRARYKLIIIADKVTLTRYAPFKNLFDVIDEKNVISLQDGKEEFNWENLIRGIDSINREKESKEDC